MTRTQARQAARKLDNAEYYGIEIREQFPEGNIELRSVNPAGIERCFYAMSDVEDELREDA